MEATFYATQYSGHNRARNTNWATLRATTTSSEGFTTNGANMELHAGWIPWLSKYHLSRAHILFDTSSIPANATITSASIIINKASADGGTRYTHAVASTKSANANLVDGDIAQFGSTSFGSVNTTTTGEKTISLDANGIANITKGGISKFGLRIDKDLNNTTPTDYDENGYIWGPSNATQSNRPRLVVNYTVPTTTGGFILAMI